MKGKYVVGLITGAYGTTVAAMIFGEAVVHAEVVRSMFGGKRSILGAGFFHLSTSPEGGIQLSHYGRSDSLGIAARPEDQSYLEVALGMREGPDGRQFRNDRAHLLKLREDFEEAAYAMSAKNPR